MKYVLLFLAVVAPALCQVINLEKYNIDPATVTVSGLSSGGCFATQYHVVYSGELMGVAVFAGVHYHCAGSGSSGTAIMCMDFPSFTNVNTQINQAKTNSNNGKIDPTTGMAGDKVYIFAGTKDSVVKPANGDQIQTFYEAFGADITTEFSVVAEHCQPTDNFGPACTYNGGNYINNCDYNGAYEALKVMFNGVLARPDPGIALNGQFSLFNQDEFFGNKASSFSMDTSGYVYIPSGCADHVTPCHLHVAFHGCLQGKQAVGDTYATKTEYIEVGEANNIIMLFPQAVKSMLSNPNGCWDWWGYNGILRYGTNTGDQEVGIHAMTQRLIYGL